MIRRVLTAAVMAPGAVLTILYSPPWLFLALTALVACACFAEFARLARGHGMSLPLVAGLAAGLVMLLVPLEQAFLAAVLATLAGLALAARSQADMAGVLGGAAALSLGLLYCFAPWRCGIALRALAPHWLLFPLALNWIADSGAYLGGRAFGRHKMAPAISPGKTWEGAGCSLVVSLIFGAFFLARFAPDWGMGERLALSAVTNVAGQIGDLAESAVKRGAGCKDSGGLLPGHGGWLDRLDSSLFSLPVTYAWLLRFHP